MTVAFDNGVVRLFHGSALEMAFLPDESVDCCITSPPYYGLRDYGLEPTVWDGAEGCGHVWGDEEHRRERGSHGYGSTTVEGGSPFNGNENVTRRGSFCTLCPAWLGTLGLEPTPQLYVQHLVQVFRAVKRVLKPTGSVFLNLGDSYASQSSVNYAIIKQQLSPREFMDAALAIQRYMPEVWEGCWNQASQGDVSPLLSEGIQGHALRASAGASTSALSEEFTSTQRQGAESEEAAQARDDRDAGGAMCLLRGEGGDVSLPRPHQGEWSQRVRQGGGPSRSLEKGNSGGASEGQVQDSLLELQFSVRLVRALSSLRLDLASLHGAVKPYFQLETGLKPKDLIGIPWHVAFALQQDGWWLRSDVIWSKPNGMPESVTDRPTKSHEYVFLLTKSEQYYYDAEAIKEQGTSGPSDLKKMEESQERIGGKHKNLVDPLSKASSTTNIGHKRAVGSPLRNRRSVWEVATQPFGMEMCEECGLLYTAAQYKRLPSVEYGVWDDEAEAWGVRVAKQCKRCRAHLAWMSHFAVFPEALVEPCILAGTSERGNCAECGRPWERVVERTRMAIARSNNHPPELRTRISGTMLKEHPPKITGWRPTCSCNAATVPAVVLDPFMGSGTVGVVAQRLGRRAIGVDQSEPYLALAQARIAATPLPMVMT